MQDDEDGYDYRPAGAAGGGRSRRPAGPSLVYSVAPAPNDASDKDWASMARSLRDKGRAARAQRTAPGAEVIVEVRSKDGGEVDDMHVFYISMVPSATIKGLAEAMKTFLRLDQL